MPMLSLAATPICASPEVEDGYVVGFFNGVGNDEDDAQLALAYIAKVYGNTYNDLTIKYEPFFNHTGRENNSNVGQDLTEVFRQRADEMDPSGYLGSRFELFYAMTTNDSGGLLADLFSTIGATNDLLKGLIQDLNTDISNEVLARVGETFYDLPTISDYNIHSTRITTLTSQGSRMIYIAHSQGNLFANVAYDYTLGLSNMSSSNVGVVHVAPATTTTNGTHVLADKDLVINGLRLTGTVPENTVTIPIAHLAVDPTGHGFLKTYMEKSLDTYGQVISTYNGLLDTLDAPEQIAQSGGFTATLNWDGTGDVDLHTFESTGTQVYYSNKTGDVGFLDVDDTQGYGPEHYYASCDNADLMAGTFTFGVNNYSGANGRVATIQVSTPSVANLITRTVTLGGSEGSAGNSNPNIMITLNINEVEEGLEMTVQ